MNKDLLKNTASQVRRDILRMVHAVNSGHPGGSLGCADFLSYLYFEQMDYDSKKRVYFKRSWFISFLQGVWQGQGLSKKK